MMMMKTQKPKDQKSKQKLQLTKSTQNLLYMTEPLNLQALQNMNSIIKANDLDKLQTIYQTQLDTQAKRLFLKTQTNQYKQKDTGIISYRSPYTNRYFPQIKSQGPVPSPLVRNIEQKGQIMFEQYAKLYYGVDEEGSSVVANFFVQQNEDQFCFVFCVQKKYKEQGSAGIWNSTNIANITGDPTKSISYKVTTSVIYQLTCYEDNDINKPFTIQGNLKKLKNQSKKLTPDQQIDQLHLTVIGKIIQENQSNIRSQIQQIYARKTKQIINKTRILNTKNGVEEQRKIMKGLMENMNLAKKENAIQF